MAFWRIPDLSRRRREPELMDQPGLDGALHRTALRGLERVNRLSRSAHIVWPKIRAVCREASDRPVRVLDLACGGGDVAVTLKCIAERRRLPIDISGCDVSPVAVDHARSHAERREADVQFFQLDVLAEALPEDFDVVMCSLFLHHLDDHQAVGLLQAMGRSAKRLVLANDLRRTQRGYWLACVGTRVLSRSQIVRTDGPASVLAAFTIDEARQLAEQAGLAGAHVKRVWPQRYLLSWSKP